MKIRLYQLSKDVYPHARFLPYSEALKAFRDDELPGAIYNLVFEGFVDCPDIEGVYTLFNVESEKYYKGHSLSVSDIVEVLNESYADEGKFYYVEYPLNKFMIKNTDKIDDVIKPHDMEQL